MQPNPERIIKTINKRYSRTGYAGWRAGMQIGLVAILIAPQLASAAVKSWTGAGGNNYWRTSANWSGGVAPVAGDDLFFQANALVDGTSLNNTNDFTAGTAFGTITFQSGATNYMLNGNQVLLSSPGVALSCQSSGLNTMNCPIQLGAGQVFELTVAGNGLVLNGNINLNGNPLTNSVATSARITIVGVISGTGDLAKSGNGTLLLAGLANNTYSGITRVLDGTLELNDGAGVVVNMVPGDVIISAGATLLLGEGNQIADSADVTVQGSVTTFLTVNGRLNLNGWNETIASLTLSGGGDVATGVGTLTLGGDVTASASGNINVGNPATITGNLSLGSATRTFNVANNLFVSPELAISANINGSGTAGVTKTGSGAMRLSGANTYPGLTLLSSGWTFAGNDVAFGSGAAGTTIDGGDLTLESVTIANEWLTNNADGTFIHVDSAISAAWLSNIVLAADCTMDVLTNGTLEIGGIISGSGAVTKTGPGTLLYSGSQGNTYTNTTTVNDGFLDLNKPGTLYAVKGPLVIGDGIGVDTVRCLANNQFWSTSIRVRVNSSGVLDLGDYVDYVGPLTLDGGQVKTTDNGEIWLFRSVTVLASAVRQSTIDGRAGLYSSTLTFSNYNHNFSPDLRINAHVRSSAADIGIIKTGPGEVLLAASNSFTGPVTINSGALGIGNSFALGNTNTTATVNPGGSLWLDAVLNPINVGNKPLVLNGPHEFGLGALAATWGSCSWTGQVTLASDCQIYANDSLNLLGPIIGSGGFTKVASGTLSLAGNDANTYTGATYVNGGRLQLAKPYGVTAVGGNLTIGDGAGGANADVVEWLSSMQVTHKANLTITNSGLMSMPTHDERVGSLSGSGNIDLGTSGDLYFGSNNVNTVFSGIISGLGGEFYKEGTSIVTFSGDNTLGPAGGYSYILQGTLLVDGSQPACPIEVISPGILGGSGTVGHVFMTAVNGGSVAPGSSAGCLTTSNVTFSASSDYFVELNGTSPCTGYDQLNVRGTNTLAGATLHVTTAFPPSQPVTLGDQFVIISNDGIEAVTGTFAGLANGAEFSADGYRFRIQYGNDVTLTTVGLPLSTVASAVTTGNGNHVIDPNECNFLCLAITNQSGTPMNDVSAVLSTTHPRAVVMQPYSDFPNIPAASQRTNVTPFQLSTMANFPCGDTIPLQLQVTSSTHGSFVVPVSLGSGEPSAAPFPYNNNVSLGIPDVATVESTNAVAGFYGPLLRVTVSVYLTHTAVGDLSLSLISPDGVVVDLSSANGGTGDDFGTNCTPETARTTFDDTAAVPITAGLPPFVGVFRPEGSLATLIGGSANGDWRLSIRDVNGGSLGTLRCWTLNLYGVKCADGGGFCDFCMGGVAGSIDAADPVAYRIERYRLMASCGDPKPFPGPWAGNHRYDLHSFPNTTGGDACVTVHLRGNCDVQAAAYLNSFNPADVSQNYLADAGYSTGSGSLGLNGPTTFSCTVPAGATLVVKVNEVTPGEGCVLYNLYVSGLPCPQPSLVAEPSGASKVRVHWPTWAGGYGLESTTTLPAGSWVAVPEEPIVNGGRLNVTNNSASPDTRFYRLNKPE